MTSLRLSPLRRQLLAPTLKEELGARKKVGLEEEALKTLSDAPL